MTVAVAVKLFVVGKFLGICLPSGPINDVGVRVVTKCIPLLEVIEVTLNEDLNVTTDPKSNKVKSVDIHLTIMLGANKPTSSSRTN